MYKVPMTNEKRLEQIRTKTAKLSYQGITQKQICEDIGMSEPYFSLMLRGKRLLTSPVVEYFEHTWKKYFANMRKRK